ncbi:MAG: hypothetical protein ACREV6_02150 [Clostridium sp.]|uniref:hypothetical protein n=1 Tax=Clostridium sp. TaxID=1506 RepID=UPI003D6D885F
MKFSNQLVGVFIDDLYDEGLRVNLVIQLKELGDNINFKDDIWFCNKNKKSNSVTDSSLTLDFSKTPEKYKDFVKYFALKHFSEISTIQNIIREFNRFNKFLFEKYVVVDLKDLNRNIIGDYKKNLKNNSNIGNVERRKRWSNLRVFLNTMQGWPELPKYTLISSQDNPFKIKTTDKKNDSNYPPKEITNKLDWIFIHEDYIPTWIKISYFYLRLYPNRGVDICGILIENCLRPFGSMYTLTIPNLKESIDGEVQNKVLYINAETEIEIKFIELIQKQKEISKKYQHLLPEDKRGLLFTFPNCSLNKTKFRKSGIKEFRISDSKVSIADSKKIYYEFKIICELYNLKYKGKEYHITPKQLRHKEITDRLDSGFSGFETKSESGHTTDIMNTTYYHHLEDEQKKIQYKYNRESEPNSENNIEFGGHILGEMALKRLLNKRQSHELVTPGGSSLGVCSDKFSCPNNDVFDPYLCLGCSEFDSESENKCKGGEKKSRFIDFYKKEAEMWNKDYIFFSNNNNVIYRDIAKQNLDVCMKMLAD